jgi:electron transfer flavoprotein beta subunit
MKIFVCVKHVPDSAAHIAIIDNIRIDENISFLLNPYDEHALTEAVRIREMNPGSEVIAVCLGKADAEKTLRSAMAMGADRGILIKTDKRHDSIETALALKTAIEQDGSPALIFTGKESIDDQGMQTLFRLGALFDFPAATNVVRLDIVSGKAVADTEFSGGAVSTYEMSLPCVIGAGKGLNTPKYPTVRDVMRSRKSPIQAFEFSDLNMETPKARMEVIELIPYIQKRQPKEITGNPSEIAQKIVEILKNEAKVL